MILPPLSAVEKHISANSGEENKMKTSGRFAIGWFTVLVLFLATAMTTPARAGELKWHQPPDMQSGVNIESVDPEPAVADDWQCRDPRPVTEVYFWGSYLGWRESEPEAVAPPGVEAFVVRIYTDVPQGEDPQYPYSHPPGYLLYEVRVENFSEQYVGSIQHPDQTYEHKFQYSLVLAEPFIQEEGTVYWISIAAVMPEGSAFPWGWETSYLDWNDDACRYWFYDEYWEKIPLNSLPPWYQESHQRVDMAFALMVGEPGSSPVPGPIKWQQRPDMKHGVNTISTPCLDPPDLMGAADDWLCLDGSPVTSLHFWGSYPGWNEGIPGPLAPPLGAIQDFRVRIYFDYPAATIYSMSRPACLLYEETVPAADFREMYVTSIFHPDGTFTHQFRYDLDLPRVFWQRRGQVYWISIAARTSAGFPYPWGWEITKDRWNDYAVQGCYRDVYTWNWDVLKSPPLTLTFNDLVNGITYPAGSSFTTCGVSVAVRPFLDSGGHEITSGKAEVGSFGWAGGAGREIKTDAVNLEFSLPYPVTDVSWLFGEYGGNLNLTLNGIFKNFDNYQEINGAIINNVEVSATNGSGSGSVSLQGIVTSLALGGQQHWVDNLSYSRFLDLAFALGTCGGPAVWQQLPDMADGVNIISPAAGRMVADDFFYAGENAVAEVHFWGSYLTADRHWEQNNPGPPLKQLPESPGVRGFWLSFYKNVPADESNPRNHPGELIREVRVDYRKEQEQYWDSVPHTGADGRTWWEHKFYYSIELETPFQPGEYSVCWLGIGAVPIEEDGWLWGWETSQQHWNGSAAVYHEESGSWDSLAEIYGSPVDMAFLLLTEDDTEYCLDDFDRDGDVDGADLALFLADFNRVNCFDQGDCEGDTDYDGRVDSNDLHPFAAGFGRDDCPCKLPSRFSP
ncbi:MAG: hypothetical protein DRH04_08190 [Deltaproteobacteria bacterium]|nr:MAG: hypothetical protein DRH04_08190 [Deltaproteobacteria bacterium]